MGLLDQVLGQVLGQMGGGHAPAPGGAGGRSDNPLAPHRGSGLPPSGAGTPQNQGGGLPGGLGGMLGGNLPPIALAILALLASKHLKTGAGGYGSVLHDMLAGQTGGGGAPADEADDDNPVGRSAPRSGGFLDQIGGMLGGGASMPQGGGSNPAGRVGDPGSQGGFGGGMGGLGGLLGSLAGGGALGGGLGNLLEHLSRGGLGDKASSWVGPGGNESVEPDELDQALGQDNVDDLSRATGLDRGDLLSQLSRALPEVVDKLTPQGRLPSQEEESRWV